MRNVAVTDTFTDVKRLVSQVTKSFQRKYGGNWGDLISQAHLHYVEAFIDHTPAKGTFSNHVTHKIWWGLMNAWKRNRQYDGRFRGEEKLDRRPLQSQPSSILYLRNLFCQLSMDGREVVEMALDYSQPNISPFQTLVRLRMSLSKMGWTKERIESTFSEVRSTI